MLGAAPARSMAWRMMLLSLVLPLLLLLLPPGAAAGAATAGGAAADDGNGDASGSGSSIQLMLDSFKEIASCPGAPRVGCVCRSSPFRLGVEIESRSNLAPNRPWPTPTDPHTACPRPTHTRHTGSFLKCMLSSPCRETMACAGHCVHGPVGT